MTDTNRFTKKPVTTEAFQMTAERKPADLRSMAVYLPDLPDNEHAALLRVADTIAELRSLDNTLRALFT